MGRLERKIGGPPQNEAARINAARRNARYPRLYAHAGEHITCERGHVIGTFARDVVVGAVFTVDMIKDWHPKLAAMLPGTKLGGCPQCGAAWVDAKRGKPGLLHVEGGWRRSLDN